MPIHAGYLADVYMSCGCFSEAREKYLKPEHPRKLGDICWCEGNLEQAELYYSKAKSEAQSYRSAPDDDRLIKLAFFQEKWDKVVNRFANASFSKWSPPNEVCIGSSVTKTQPYLDMLAVAICQLKSPTTPQVLNLLENLFGLSEKQWDSFRMKPAHMEAKTVAKLKARCRPRLGAAHALSVEEALGKLLDLRFKNRLPLTTADILTGIFQMLGRPNLSADAEHDSEKEMVLAISRLASCREWARIRLEEWIHSHGAKRANEVAEIWRDGRAQPASHPFYIGVIGAPESPRNMTEWNSLMAEALMWLQRRWKREIGSSPWVAENQLHQILRRLLKGIEVVQHARLTWLEPQHLDIYVPQAGIAVEYMGQQHFEPMEFFGGEPAFQLVIERDRKKAELCKNHSVELIRVRFDEDVGIRAKDIAKQISSALTVE